MTDGNQIFIFLVCVTCGIAGGVIYDFFYCLAYPFRTRAVRIVADAVFSLFFTALFLFVSVTFSLPDFRIYMFLGCVFGLFLYLKSFHGIVAFFAEMVYNRIERLKRMRKAVKRGCTSRKRKPKESR